MRTQESQFIDAVDDDGGGIHLFVILIFDGLIDITVNGRRRCLQKLAYIWKPQSVHPPYYCNNNISKRAVENLLFNVKQ